MILSIDIETKSSVDLAKCGVYKYTEDKSFEILLIAYAFDDEEVSVIDIKCGDLIPSRVREAILNPKIIILKNSITTINAPTNPNSSQIIENIKSVWGSGK